LTSLAETSISNQPNGQQLIMKSRANSDVFLFLRVFEARIFVEFLGIWEFLGILRTLRNFLRNLRKLEVFEELGIFLKKFGKFESFFTI
jgi:hypothetical protein